MYVLDKIKLEYRSSAIFAVIAFIITILAGIIGGIDFSVIVIRILIAIPFFAALGYGVIYVIKTYVPELYELLTSLRTERREGEPEEMEVEDRSGRGISEPVAGEAPEEFTETRESDYEHIETPVTSEMDASLNPSQGKLGKHIVVNEKFGKYEPKLMAQAVRTMMRKDE